MAKPPLKESRRSAHPVSSEDTPVTRPFFKPIHLTLGSLLLIAGLLYLIRGKLLIATPRAYRFCLIGSALSGFGLGFLWWWRQPRWDMTFRWINSLKKQIVVVGMVAIGILTLTMWCGLSQIGGFDHSVLIDLAWRMSHGQVPYQDFPCTLPPGFFLGALYAFKLFGPFWQSIILVQALFATGAFIWIYWLLNHILKNRVLAILIAFSSQAISTMLVAYWWYNPITAVSAVIFVLSCALWLLHPELLRGQVTYFCSLLLFALMKPNVAGPLIALCVVLLLTSNPHRSKVIVLSIAAFLTFVSIFLIHHLSVEEMLRGYNAVAERGFSSRLFQDARANEKRFIQVLFCLIFLPFISRNGFSNLRLGARVHGVLVFGTLAGIYGFFTNGENTLVDCPLALVCGTLYAILPREGAVASFRRSTFWTRYCGFVAIFVACAGLGEAAMRTRVKEIGHGLFYDYSSIKDTESGFFKNSRYSPVFNTTKSQVANALQKLSTQTHKPVTELKVFFGPRMQWAYANFNLQSPAGLPIWWHPGVAFARKDEPKYIREWANTDFDALIILRSAGATYLSSDFLTEIRNNFAADESFSNVQLLLPIRKLDPKSIKPNP